VVEDVSPRAPTSQQNSLAEGTSDIVAGEGMPRSPARSDRSFPPTPTKPSPAPAAATSDQESVRQLQAQLEKLKRESGAAPTSRQSRAELIAQARAAGSRKHVSQRNMYL
jgi:hypothetical protein